MMKNQEGGKRWAYIATLIKYGNVLGVGMLVSNKFSLRAICELFAVA